MSDVLGDDPYLRGVPRIGGLPFLPPCLVLETIGAGGMGAVYRARHVRLDMDVALKCLKPGALSRDPTWVLRFQREARLAASINHQNLVRAYDVSQQGELHYLIMEYVPGEDVRGRVQRRGPLPESQALAVVGQAALGLDAAHKRGVVHRDIKPDNILIDTDGLVKLADLGLAKALEPDAERPAATQHTTVIGTPRYMAPEQWEDVREVRPAADVYALGATLYYLLAGGDALPQTSVRQLMKRVLTERFPDLREALPDARPELARLIARATALEEHERPADAAAFLVELDAVADWRSVRVGPAPMPQVTEIVRVSTTVREQALRSLDPAAFPATLEELPAGGADRHRDTPQAAGVSGGAGGAAHVAAHGAPGATPHAPATAAGPAPSPAARPGPGRSRRAGARAGGADARSPDDGPAPRRPALLATLAVVLSIAIVAGWQLLGDDSGGGGGEPDPHTDWDRPAFEQALARGDADGAQALLANADAGLDLSAERAWVHDLRSRLEAAGETAEALREGRSDADLLDALGRAHTLLDELPEARRDELSAAVDGGLARIAQLTEQGFAAALQDCDASAAQELIERGDALTGAWPERPPVLRDGPDRWTRSEAQRHAADADLLALRDERDPQALASAIEDCASDWLGLSRCLDERVERQLAEQRERLARAVAFEQSVADFRALLAWERDAALAQLAPLEALTTGRPADLDLPDPLPELRDQLLRPLHAEVDALLGTFPPDPDRLAELLHVTTATRRALAGSTPAARALEGIAARLASLVSAPLRGGTRPEDALPTLRTLSRVLGPADAEDPGAVLFADALAECARLLQAEHKRVTDLDDAGALWDRLASLDAALDDGGLPDATLAAARDALDARILALAPAADDAEALPDLKRWVSELHAWCDARSADGTRRARLASDADALLARAFADQLDEAERLVRSGRNSDVADARKRLARIQNLAPRSAADLRLRALSGLADADRHDMEGDHILVRDAIEGYVKVAAADIEIRDHAGTELRARALHWLVQLYERRAAGFRKKARETRDPNVRRTAENDAAAYAKKAAAARDELERRFPGEDVPES